MFFSAGLHFIAWVRTPVQDTVEKVYPLTLCRYCTLIVLIPSPTPLQAQYDTLIPHSKWYILVTGIPTLAMKCNPATLCRMMKEKPVLYEVDAQNRTAVITLNRPRKQNAFNNEIYNTLVECLDAAENDARVIAVVLTANGPAFSSGADLNEVTQDLADSSKYSSIAHRPPGLFMMRLLSFKKLLIAAVNGPAVGK
jgi:Enoyl-CoA hydratase/isomerase